jgi:predicted xylose isomerase-like sugar epimerase
MKNKFAVYNVSCHTEKEGNFTHSFHHTTNKDRTMSMRYLYIDNKETLVSLNNETYVYVMSFEPFKPQRIQVKNTSLNWILFSNKEECTAYYQDIF